jgi:hypothetical protein
MGDQGSIIAPDHDDYYPRFAMVTDLALTCGYLGTTSKGCTCPPFPSGTLVA